MDQSAIPTAKEALSKAADHEIAKAITDQGLSVIEYAAIIEVARNDRSVRERLLQRMDPMTK